MKSSRYMTRALKSKDPRFARILGTLGYAAEPDVKAKPEKARAQPATPRAETNNPKPAAKTDPLDHDSDGRKGGSVRQESTDEMAKLRADYEAAVGRRPFMGWDADTLRERITEAARYSRRDMKAED